MGCKEKLYVNEKCVFIQENERFFSENSFVLRYCTFENENNFVYKGNITIITLNGLVKREKKSVFDTFFNL